MSRLDMLHEALALTERGLAVLPLHSVTADGKCTCLKKGCGSVAKHPRTKHGHRDASTERAQITMWWKACPAANVGVLTGSGYVVLDIDPRNGGRESMRGLEAQHGPLPLTWTTLTGGDGDHYYLSVDGDIPTRTGLFKGIDLKGVGGFVVAPPSKHATGKRYAWAKGRSPSDIEIARAPNWLLEVARGGVRPAAKNVTPLRVQEGGRNTYVASFAGRLRRGGVDGSELMRRVLEENERRCAPPLSSDEVARVVASIERYPVGPANGIAKILESTGATALGKQSPATEREAVVLKLAEIAPKLERVQVALLREELVRRRVLPARLADAALRPPNCEATSGLQGQALVLADSKPWEESVNGAVLLDELVGIVRRHIVIPECAAHAMALWILHTHALEPAQITPRLAVLSPEKRCGKTTVLKVLGRLVRRPLSTTNVTAAALFRTIEKFQPTLLVDEADTFLREREELRGILNTGHDRAGAEVVRCVGDDAEPRRFATWAPVALAAIGEIHDTLSDRSVVIRMKRRTATESVAPLRRKHVAQLDPLPSKCARWAADNNARLAGVEVEAPPELNDRAADNWEALLAIADLAGGEWPARARRAALALSVGPEEDDASSRAQALLADVRDLYERSKAERLLTKDLLKELNALEGRPWADYGHGKGISAHQMAALLRRFGIHPQNIRVGTSILKGYFADDFKDAFVRYLGSRHRYDATSAEAQAVSGDGASLQPDPVADAKNDTSQPDSAAVADVAASRGDPVEDSCCEGEEYDILAAFDGDLAHALEADDEIDPVEAAYLLEERLGIQEFGS